MLLYFYINDDVYVSNIDMDDEIVDETNRIDNLKLIKIV